MGKEHLASKGTDEEILRNLYERVYGALYDFIDETPSFVVSAGIAIEGSERGRDYGSPAVFKCQRAWLTR